MTLRCSCTTTSSSLLLPLVFGVAALFVASCTRPAAPEGQATAIGQALQAEEVEEEAREVAREEGVESEEEEEAAEEEEPPAPVVDRITLPDGWGTAPAPPLGENSERVNTGIDYVILLVVDGVRSDAIVALGDEGAPTWHRIMREGASTLNARTDPTRTYTNPNHLGMITGLPTDGDGGHGLRSNREVEGTLHELRGSYLPSLFDVTFHHGLRGAVFASKIKLDLLARSWAPEHAATSAVREDNDALRIVAEGFTDLDDETTHRRAVELLGTEDPPEFLFLQYSRSDGVGHSSGFDPTPGTPYMEELTRIDGYMAEVMSLVEEHRSMAGRTAIVLTTDHGGEGRNHFNLEQPANWTIPFAVWGPGVVAGADLYELNGDGRADPGGDIAGDTEPPPVRNIEAGSVALRMLGLPPVPGSLVGVSPPLAIFE